MSQLTLNVIDRNIFVLEKTYKNRKDKDHEGNISH
jgi:hypothetical protein